MWIPTSDSIAHHNPNLAFIYHIFYVRFFVWSKHFELRSKLQRNYRIYDRLQQNLGILRAREGEILTSSACDHSGWPFKRTNNFERSYQINCIPTLERLTTNFDWFSIFRLLIQYIRIDLFEISLLLSFNSYW